MADLFFSYTHADRERARPIVEMLEDLGWTVWWDRGIEPGMEWLPELETEITDSRAVVVLWSKTSVKSEWVMREATAGLRKKVLVPILLQAGQIPEQFSHVQAADLSNWDGETHITEVEALLRRLSNLVPPSRIDTVRPGYDPKFLDRDLVIPLPGVTGSAAVLRYLHFSVIMNPARRLAHYVAYNVDSTQFVHLPRHKDRWSADPLLPESLQMNLSLLKQSPYDRGHLMARSTGSWGEPREAMISAQQAFYWPNVAPQHQRLNREWWLELENWERYAAISKGRVTGFSGPMFSEEDEPFRGEVQLEDGLVAYDTFRVPRAYWKIVVAAAPQGKLAVAAYLMDQVSMLGQGVQRKIDLADYRITLANLEKVARLRFPPVLHDSQAW